MGTPGSDPFPNLGGLGGKPSSGISFTKGELKSAGNTIDGQVASLNGLHQKSGDLRVPWPHFGVLGWGVHSAHESAIESQAQALQRAREALASWKPALHAADDNYRKADDSTNPNLPLGSSQMPQLPTMPAADLPKNQAPKLADMEVPQTPPLPQVDVPNGGNPPGTDLPGTPPGTDVPGGPGTDPSTGQPNANLPNNGLPDPNLAGKDPADMRVPDLDSALNNPNKTDLSSYQPPATPQVPSIDPNLANRLNPNSLGMSPGTGLTPGTTGIAPGVSGLSPGGIGANGLTPGAAGARLAGAPGMPMMPMGGAGAGGKEERDRDQTVGLSEDEGVWGDDEDLAPQVIGQEDL
ncbi:hypothetical protein OUY22_27505 [Nonomuraea sp. MCN248]|uniref:PPE domain-containing protein n=1 Tax=Nonomuraea corallina TaxID=2989783 RepID=A0ABT4SJ77_9ACTN|nr:hypothetical protein [Nonomuraea corallina]MDA0637165.1 hypothetical protein [Nonomuraea corallina]